MTWKVALVTHGGLLVALVVIWIVYAVKLNRSRKAEAKATIKAARWKVEVEIIGEEMAALRAAAAVKEMDDESLSDAVHDALRSAGPGDAPSGG